MIGWRAGIAICIVLVVLMRYHDAATWREALFETAPGIGILYLGNWLAYRRELRAIARNLQRLGADRRQEVLSLVLKASVRRSLHNHLRDDVPLPDMGPIARFRSSPVARRGAARRAAFWAAIGMGLAAVAVRGAPSGGWARSSFSGLGTVAGIRAGFLLRRWRRLGTQFEVSPFNIAAIHGAGRRDVLSWNQPLFLRHRPRLGRVEIIPLSRTPRIAIDHDTVEFARLLELVREYGEFTPLEDPA